MGAETIRGVTDIVAASESTPCLEDSENGVCRFVQDVTGNTTAAQVADWVTGKPLAIVTLIVVALVIRWVLYRVIDRVTARAARGAVAGSMRRSRSDAPRRTSPGSPRSAVNSGRAHSRHY